MAASKKGQDLLSHVKKSGFKYLIVIEEGENHYFAYSNGVLAIGMADYVKSMLNQHFFKGFSLDPK